MRAALIGLGAAALLAVGVAPAQAEGAQVFTYGACVVYGAQVDRTLFHPSTGLGPLTVVTTPSGQVHDFSPIPSRGGQACVQP